MSDMDALRDKYLSILMEEASSSLTAEQRKSSATIIRTKADGTKEYKFPMPDEKHARLALSMINTSDLSQTEKEKVRNRAERMLEAKGKSMPPWMKNDEDSDPDDEDDKKDKKGYHKMPNGKMMKGEKHSMKEGYGKKKEPMKETGAMVPAGDAILPKKGGPKAKKDLMKEANGMIGAKASDNPPTNKKMMENWEGGGDMGQTGDPKKKPIKSKKSWLAKGDTPPPMGD